MTPKPHGGKLVSRTLGPIELEKVIAQQEEYPSIEVNEEVVRDIENIASGVFSPLEGFLGEEEFQNILHEKRLSSGLPWTIPIVLDAPGERLKGLKEGEELLLKKEGEPKAVLHLDEIYPNDKRLFMENVFATNDPLHPGVAKVYNMGDYLLGGKIDLIKETLNPYQRYALKPAETRRLFGEKGWKTIVGFQTRNVPHLGHEYIQKTALTFVDGLFINPVIGRKKKGDFKDEVILETYEVLLENYYPRDSVVMGIFQTEMRYAGPREAIFHAIVRKNFGCTHFIVGRDHAGVGSYYHPYAAQEIFSEFPDLGITPMFFKSFYYCKKCEAQTNEKVCPHDEHYRVNFSGTRMRELIERGEMLPRDSMRHEVSEVILKHKNPFVD